MFKMNIGVEIHVELKTEEKLFCGCENVFSREPNKNICPVCLGLPGALPRVNPKVIELAVKAGRAVGGEVQNISVFDRKNYFYVDNPKNYQITQFYKPVVKGGELEFYLGDEKRSVGITQIHIEEDAGKLLHVGGDTLIDFNRAGVPLIEIVTEPHMTSKEECSAFLMDIRRVLLWNGISDCKMEEGSIRFDLNISLREGEELGQRIEVKNINSFKNVQKCIDYEYKRQEDILKNGGTISFETRRWDDKKEISVSLRKKEEARDYRYIPDGDLLPLELDEWMIEGYCKGIKPQPWKRIEKLCEEYSMNMKNAKVISSDDALYELYLECAGRTKDYKSIGVFILGEVSGVMKECKGMKLSDMISGLELSEIIGYKNQGEINNSAAKVIIREIMINGGEVLEIIERKGLMQKNDTKEIQRVIGEMIQDNMEKVLEYREGKEKLYGWFFGGVMKALKGQGNPNLIHEILKEKLKK